MLALALPDWTPAAPPVTEPGRLLAAVASGPIAVDVVHHADLLTLCAALPDRSVDMILADLPYGTTACEWDEALPLNEVWRAFQRVVKPRGVVALTSSQPFTSSLVCSNMGMFRCEWIWHKPQGTGYLNANRQPMKNHESILIFAEGAHCYRPIMREGRPYRATSGAVGGFVRDKTVGGYLTVNMGERYPLSVLDFNAETGLHPTQKPVALFEYFIRTYTRPGEVVLDPVCGSGTTAIAARNTGRHWICGDKEEKYVTIAKERLAVPYTPPLPFDAPAVPAAVQPPLLEA